MNCRWIIRCPRCGKKHERAFWLRPLENIHRTHRCRQCGKLFLVLPMSEEQAVPRQT